MNFLLYKKTISYDKFLEFVESTRDETGKAKFVIRACTITNCTFQHVTELMKDIGETKKSIIRNCNFISKKND